jgi:ATP-binding cassette subfamily B protein
MAPRIISTSHPLLRVLRGQRLRFGAALGALIIGSCFLYLAPMVPQIVLDGVVAPAQDADTPAYVDTAVERMGGRAFVRENLWLPGVLIAVLAAFAGFFTYLRGRWSARATEIIIRDLRDRLFDHLQRLPCSYFDGAETGDLIQRCTSDVETVRVFLSRQVVEIGRAIVMLVLPLPLMLAIDGRMTLVSVVLIPPIVAFSLVFFLKVKKAFKEMDEAEGKMTATIQENLTGIRVVRAFHRQEHERAKLAERNATHRKLDRRLYRLFAWFWASSDLMCMAQKGLVVGFGAWWLARGELQVGAFFFFLSAVTLFIWPVRMMGRILADAGKAVVALGRLDEILSQPEEDASSVASGERQDSPLSGRIVFESVGFSHGPDARVLSDVSFAIEPGQTLAILGPSGSGKSTIINVLLRLYDLEEGRVLLDGHDLMDLDRRWVRSQVGVVMQTPFLFSKTLRDNIRLSRVSASDDEIVDAAAVACVHETILEFDRGYDTMVGERGVTLSGGQRQRVAIARAVLRDPPILVLDDALSAVDTETESTIIDALRRRHSHRTTIVIAHRLSTLAHADRILVLEHGRVVQSGSHAELYSQDGLYRRLWDLQTAVEAQDLDIAVPMGREEVTHDRSLR